MKVATKRQGKTGSKYSPPMMLLPSFFCKYKYVSTIFGERLTVTIFKNLVIY